MDNEELSYNYWRDRARELYSEAEAKDGFTRDERAALSLMDLLKQEHEDAQPNLTEAWADLMNAALSEVNWHEIAVSLINDEVNK